MPKYVKQFNHETVRKAIASLDRSRLDGTHADGILCHRCGQRTSGVWEFVQRGKGLAK